MTAVFTPAAGARTIKTATYLELADMLEEARDTCAIYVGHGPAKVGKTHSAQDLVARSPETRMLNGRTGIKPTTLLADLFTTVTGDKPDTQIPSLILPILLERLSQVRVVVIDDAGRLSCDLFAFLRELHGSMEAHFGLVLLGRDELITQIRRKAPALHEEIYRDPQFEHLSQRDVLEILPKYHPIWSAVDPLTLRQIDKRCAYGIFGRWAFLTALVVEACGESGADHPSASTIDAAIRAVLLEAS